MNTSNRKLILASFGLVAYLLSCLVRVDGIVLCIGQDGHIELESAAPDFSCKVPMPGKGKDIVFSASQGLIDQHHCGPCRDISLSLTAAEAIASVPPTQSKSVKTQLASIAGSSFALLPPLTLTCEEPIHRPSVQNLPLAALRTVILLI